MHDGWHESNATSCGGKKKYRSFQTAQNFHNQMRRTRMRQGIKENLHPYRCQNCGMFHLGHPRRKKKIATYVRRRSGTDKRLEVDNIPL
jgi:hypothetical protein